MNIRVVLNYLAIAVSSLLAGGAQAVELISNGGFESGSFHADAAQPDYETIGAGSANQDLASWTVTKGSLVWGLNASDINTHAGSGFVDLTGLGDNGNHGTLSQTIATVVGQSYDFSVYTTLDLGRGGIKVDVSGQPLALSGSYGYWNETPTGASWGQLSGSFVATSASTTIDIAGVPGFSFMIGLDDVSVTGPAASSVPEPSTAALGLTGLSALVVARRRRAGWFGSRG